MSAALIDGKAMAEIIRGEAKAEAEALLAQGITPCLAVILVGENPASQVYVRNKKLACAQAGIRSLSFELPATLTEDALLTQIEELNADDSVHGILVQLPLPDQIDEKRILTAISPQKDVDGFHPQNVGALHTGEDSFLPCTPAGILELIKRSGYTIKGKECVVIGRSNIVGKPVAMLLLREHGTVTICHTRTVDMPAVCRRADILIVATGKRHTLTKDMVKPGAIVIDVGMNRDEAGKLCGDVDFAEVSEVAGAITPVPGGVGPMTIAMLMKNCVQAARMLSHLEG